MFRSYSFNIFFVFEHHLKVYILFTFFSTFRLSQWYTALLIKFKVNFNRLINTKLVWFVELRKFCLRNAMLHLSFCAILYAMPVRTSNTGIQTRLTIIVYGKIFTGFQKLICWMFYYFDFYYPPRILMSLLWKYLVFEK